MKEPFFRGVLITVIAGVVLWLITQFILVPVFIENDVKEGDKISDSGNSTNSNSSVSSKEDIEKILQEAQVAFQGYGFEAALEIINDGLLKHSNNEALNKAQEDYKKYAPVSITKFEQLKNTSAGSTNSWTDTDKYTEDKFGNTYTHSFSLAKGSVSFYVGKEYSVLRGVVACPKEITYDSFRTSAFITIYLDDETYFVSDEVEVDSRPQSFEIPIKGVEVVKIRWESNGANIWCNWGDYATLFDTVFCK